MNETITETSPPPPAEVTVKLADVAMADDTPEKPASKRTVEEIFDILENPDKPEYAGVTLGRKDAMILISIIHSRYIIKNPDKFQGLDKDVALALIEDRYAFWVMENLDKFQGLTLDKEMAMFMIQNNRAEAVIKFIDKFQVSDKELAIAMIKHEAASIVFKNIDKFQGLTLDKEFAMTLIDIGFPGVVTAYSDEFQGLDKEVAMAILEDGRDVIATGLYNALDVFQGVDRELVSTIMTSGDIIDQPVESVYDEFNVTPTDVEQIRQSYLPYFGEQALMDAHADEVIVDGQLDYQKVFEILKSESREWQDEENITGPMKRGAEVFGYEKMFQYANRTDFSRHDILLAFDSILRLYDNYRQQSLSQSEDEPMSDSKLANQFFSQILQQVMMDRSGIGSRSSYIRFSIIAQNLELSPQAVEGYRGQIAKLESQGFGQEMSRLKDMLETGSYFNSWKELQIFDESLEQLRQSAVWEKLAVLKQQAETNPQKQAVYDYVATLMFHKDSKINLDAASQFFLDPDEFLARLDGHAPTEIHNRKKPSNYIDIPNLDLSGEQLVEALASGELDKIQTFPGVAITYEFAASDRLAESDNQPTSFAERVMAAVGSRKTGNANPKLFHQLRQYFKAQNLNPDPKNFAQTLPSLTAEQQAEVAKLLEQFPNSLNAQAEALKKPSQQKRFRAVVYDKSNPKAALAGDDTNCCMPFGSGKNNVYTFNPNCSVFTVEAEKPDGSWVTIAQSILTLDQDVGRNVSDIMQALESSDEDIIDALKVNDPKRYIACDNIEVRQNYRANTAVIEQIYQDFFRRYVDIFNQANLTGQTVESDKIVIGQGYSDVRFGRQEANTFVPLAPMSYSDKLGSSVDVIPLGESRQTGPETLRPLDIAVSPVRSVEFEEYIGSIAPLTFQDTLSVSQLERKAYQGTSMADGLSAMENSLIASMINNVNKNRPNLSVKHLDGAGGVNGYLVAYEGKIDELDGENGIYVEDLAADPAANSVGGRLIFAFMEQYNKHYLSQGQLLPVYAEAREDTSYSLIKRHLESFGQRYGVRLELEEFGSYDYGGRTMHRIAIRPQAV